MTIEEFMTEVQDFADTYLVDYPRKFSIGYSEDEDGIFSADITITMFDDSTWILPITQDEDGSIGILASEESFLDLIPENVWVVMWFEAMDRMEAQKTALVDLESRNETLESEGRKLRGALRDIAGENTGIDPATYAYAVLNPE